MCSLAVRKVQIMPGQCVWKMLMDFTYYIVFWLASVCWMLYLTCCNQVYFWNCRLNNVGRAKRICHLSPMRAAKVQASLRIRAVSPEPPLLAHTGSESRGTFRQKTSSLAPLNVWACAVKICHDGMLEDTNSLDGAHVILERNTNNDNYTNNVLINMWTKLWCTRIFPCIYM